MQNDFGPLDKAALNRQQTLDMPMKWHNFLIYFSLWANAVMNVINGFTYFTGMHYGGERDAEYIYSLFPGMKPVDCIAGLVCIAIAVLALVTRFSLAGFKSNGPKLLLCMYGANLAFALLYPLMTAGVTSIPFGELFEVSNLISGGVMIACNRVYYDKRAHLFVN